MAKKKDEHYQIYSSVYNIYRKIKDKMLLATLLLLPCSSGRIAYI